MTPVSPPRSRWVATSILVTASLAIGSVMVGFLVLPVMQGEASSGLWDAICRAAGILRAPAGAPPVVGAGFRTTDVVLVPGMMDGATPASIGQGATLAMQCATCHGARGISGADVPNLAGQYAPVVFKQLRDYQTGARTNAIMGPRAAAMTVQDMQDLSAYYASLPRLSLSASSGPVPAIVAGGAPMRNIAPCGACHGGVAVKAGSAWLDGAPLAYLQAQLDAFADGDRHNDISQQMRNVARNMTAAEITQAAHYYAGQ